MIARWILAALHLIALGMGFGAVWARAQWLAKAPHDRAALDRALTADAWWGVAFLLWVTTGLWRLFGGMEKQTAFYFDSHLFWGKMGLLAVILALEAVPIVTLTRWRPCCAPRTWSCISRRWSVSARACIRCGATPMSTRWGWPPCSISWSSNAGRCAS